MDRDGTGNYKILSRRKNKAIRHLYRHSINQEGAFYINDKENLPLLVLT